MRVVFMGTPEFAVPSLRALLDAGYDVVGAFAQPDRPVGRGHKLAACPVKRLALERGVPVYQFERIRGEEGLACLRALAPDIVVTAAFGQILSQALLDVPKMGTVNVHASLLPAYRGAAPSTVHSQRRDENGRDHHAHRRRRGYGRYAFCSAKPKSAHWKPPPNCPRAFRSWARNCWWKRSKATLPARSRPSGRTSASPAVSPC